MTLRYDIGAGTWYEGDTFEAMAALPDASVDMILADLPYGTTQNKWDSVLPLDRLWREYWRICKPNAAVVLTAACPFDKVLGVSALQYLKYEWIWEKSLASGHLNAKKQPMRAHENVLVFYREQCLYLPQMTTGHVRKVCARSSGGSSNYGSHISTAYDSTDRYPRSVQQFAKGDNARSMHPTQKPVALFEYLLRTYTLPGALVLDNTAGSGTTAIAAERTGRRWICIERDPVYSSRAMTRLCLEPTT